MIESHGYIFFEPTDEFNPNFGAGDDDNDDNDDGVNSHFDAADDEDKPTW